MVGSMKKWINYHHLYYFKTIAESGSISEASKILKIGQPTLSSQLKQFEEQIDQKLFERAHKKITLTESGKIALEYAKEIFRLGSEMNQTFSDQKTPNRPRLSIGATDNIPKHIVYQLASTAFALGPCTLQMKEGNDQDMIEDLLSHKIDLVITNHQLQPDGERKLFMRTIARDKVIFCASPKWKKLIKGFPKSLNGTPIVMPHSQNQTRPLIDHYFEKMEVKPECVAEVQDTSLLKIFATEGVGVIPITASAVAGLIKKGDLIVIGETPNITEPIFLASADRRFQNPIAKALWEKFSIQ